MENTETTPLQEQGGEQTVVAPQQGTKEAAFVSSISEDSNNQQKLTEAPTAVHESKSEYALVEHDPEDQHSPHGEFNPLSIEQLWHLHYRDLLEFKTKYGNLNVPKTYSKQLERWVRKQRERKRLNALSEQRVHLLEELGFDWEPRKNKKLRQQQQQIPSGVDEEGISTLSLIATSPLSLNPEHPIHNLQDASNYITDPNTAQAIHVDAAWKVQFEALKEFKRMYGHCNVMPNDEQYKPLSRWVRSQRALKRKGQLAEVRIQALTEIGMDWDQPRKRKASGAFDDDDDDLSPQHDSQTQYIPQQVGQDGVSLPTDAMHTDATIVQEGQVITDAGLVHSGLQSSPHVTPSPKTPVSRVDVWQQRYEELKHFKAKYNHCNVASRDKEWKQLGNWVRKQRERHNKGTLNPHRYSMLNELGFEWDRRRKPFVINDAADHQAHQHVENKDLQLVHHTQQHYPHDTQAQTQIDEGGEMLLQLHSVPLAIDPNNNNIHTPTSVAATALAVGLSQANGSVQFALPSSSLEEKIWNAYYEELLIFKQKFGHCNVTRNDTDFRKLANWVRKQRAAHRNGTIPQYRLQLLTSLGFEWVRWTRRSGEGLNDSVMEEEDDEDDDEDDEDVEIDIDDEEAELAKEHQNGGGALTLDDLWKSHYEQLKQFKQRFGHTNVSRSDHNWKQLGNWVRKQRERFQKGVLTEYRKQKLSELGFEWERIKRMPKVLKRSDGSSASEMASQLEQEQLHQLHQQLEQQEIIQQQLLQQQQQQHHEILPHDVSQHHVLTDQGQADVMAMQHAAQVHLQQLQDAAGQHAADQQQQQAQQDQQSVPMSS